MNEDSLNPENFYSNEILFLMIHAVKQNTKL